MRIIVIRPSHEQEDVQAAKETVETEIAHPAKSVMFILGQDQEVGQFTDRAGTRSDPFPWREAVWLQVSTAQAKEILGVARLNNWYPNADNCAVMLDFSDNISEFLKSDASLFDIDAAYLKAKG